MSKYHKSIQSDLQSSDRISTQYKSGILQPYTTENANVALALTYPDPWHRTPFEGQNDERHHFKTQQTQ